MPMEGNEKLDANDLLNLAVTAEHQKLYHSAVSFIRSADKKLSEGQSLGEDVKMSVAQFKASIGQIHNKLLSKKRTVIGVDHWVNPYLLDEVTLEKKRKQPKFVKKLDNLVDIFASTPGTFMHSTHFGGEQRVGQLTKKTY